MTEMYEIELELDSINSNEVEIEGIEVEVQKVYPDLEDLIVEPSDKEQIFNHEDSYGYDKVIVQPIPDEYLDGGCKISIENTTLVFESGATISGNGVIL